MAVNDDRLAAKIEYVRSVQMQSARRRVAADLAAHSLSDRMLTDIAQAVREEEVRKLWSHPGFPDVARAMAGQEAPASAGSGLVGIAMRDANKMTSALLALYLDATPGGLTHARLDALSDLAGVGGRTRAHALLAYMRFLGYIEPDPTPRDGRERRYRPTTRMRDAFRRYFIDRLVILLPLTPEAGPIIDRLTQDEDFTAFMAILGEGLVIMGMLHRLNTGPSLDVFSRRRSGLLTLWRLLLSAPPEAEWPPRQRFRISAIDLARKGGVARSHIQRLLRDGAAAGLLEVDEEGWVRATPLLCSEVNTYVAILAIGLGHCCREMLAARPAAASPLAAR